jgi:hypothetical protein
LIAVVMLTPIVASAMPVQVDYSFDVAQTFGGFPAPVQVTGHAVYDTDSPVAFGYLPLLSHDITVNGTAHSAIPGPHVSNVMYFQDQVPYDQPLDRVALFGYFGFELVPGLMLSDVGFVLEGPDNLLSGNGPILVNPANFTNLHEGVVTFSNGDQCPLCAVYGTLTSITFTPATSVPEPGTLALMTAGFGALFWLRRRRTN